jgi:hypothetical protein
MSEYQVYAKLQKARIKLQAAPLKKSGYNHFANYKYFELADFLPTVNEIFDELGLCSVISFDKELATLRVIDTDNGGSIAFISPMADTNMKGNQQVQNLGATLSYLRRYLYVNALEIVENDLLDAIKDKDEEKPKSAKPITKDVFDNLSEEDQERLRSFAANVKTYINQNKLEDAVLYKKSLELDADSDTAFWSLFDSKERSALKLANKALEIKST